MFTDEKIVYPQLLLTLAWQLSYTFFDAAATIQEQLIFDDDVYFFRKHADISDDC